MADTIQKRTMILVSDQPLSSKWWWMGAMRKTRRWKTLKLKHLDHHAERLYTNTRPTKKRSNSMSVATAMPATAAPSAREPVSPMNTAAG